MSFEGLHESRLAALNTGKSKKRNFDQSVNAKSTQTKGNKKRKSNPNEVPVGAVDPTVQSTKATKSAKKSRLETAEESLLDTERSLNTAISYMDSSLLLDHYSQRTRRFGEELTELELAERELPKDAIVDTNGWGDKRTKEDLPAFLRNYAEGEDLKAAPEAKGSPHTIVIAASGLRAADLTRPLREFQAPEVHVAKLFAKHIKLDEAVHRCKKMRMSVGVGTPQRIEDLVDKGALKLEGLRRVVVDASWIDVKKRGVLDMRETCVPLTMLLARKDFKELYAKEKVKVLFF